MPNNQDLKVLKDQIYYLRPDVETDKPEHLQFHYFLYAMLQDYLRLQSCLG